MDYCTGGLLCSTSYYIYSTKYDTNTVIGFNQKYFCNWSFKDINIIKSMLTTI